MLNVFYTYGLIWILVLILYMFGWSDLCVELDMKLIIFIVFSIFISLFLGFVTRKKMKFIELEKDTYKSSTIIVLSIIYLLDILYARKIPILEVLRGNSYADAGFNGIPTVHLIVSAFSIFYSIYLSYIIVCFKNKKALISYLIILSFFIILMQRQNIFICLILFLNILYAKNKDKIAKKINNKRNKNIIIIIMIIILLYGFGVFGNIRYGSSWSWNDSSMIAKLGKMNSNYPEVLPKEFFWSYVYLISPLVNLNYNIENINVEENFYKFSMEFVPEFIRNNVFEYNKEDVLLPVQSLTASTSYIRTYNYGGYFGMYIMLFVQVLLCYIIVKQTYKANREYFVVICCALEYFFIFSFFTNTIVYSTTALIVVCSMLYSTKIKIK